jgi:zinc transport system substrate-binding protein
MKNKYVFVAIMLASILAVGMGLTGLYSMQSDAAERGEELTIVTSFYPMYIATANVVGNTTGVQLENLSEPQTGCLHDFQMTPEDMKLLSTADVFIVNGGGIESFMEEVAVSYPNLTILEACSNTDLLSEDGDENEENAHAWMSVASYETQVQTITAGLSEVNPSNSDAYEENASVYLAKLETLRQRQEAVAEAADGQPVILFHEAYDYVAKDYGLAVSCELDLDEERQVSAGEVAKVLAAIREDGASCILAEEEYGMSMAETVQKEADVDVIYLDPLNRGDYDKDSYIDGMSRNIDLLEAYFGGHQDE